MTSELRGKIYRVYHIYYSGNYVGHAFWSGSDLCFESHENSLNSAGLRELADVLEEIVMYESYNDKEDGDL